MPSSNQQTSSFQHLSTQEKTQMEAKTIFKVNVNFRNVKYILHTTQHYFNSLFRGL